MNSDSLQGTKHGARPPKLSVRSMALGGMLAALVFVATYFLKIPIPMTSGYVHLGDGIILLGATLLGWLSMPAAALGSMLADLLLGWPTYALPTLIIKGLVAGVAVLAARQSKTSFKLLLWLLAEAAMVFGYFVVEWLLLGYGAAGAWANVLGNTLQGLSGVVVVLALAPVMRRVKLPPT